MANKLSRQGFALGLVAALGASTLLAVAPATANESMTLKIKDQTSNGVLATTTENDFEFVLDFAGTNTNLQYLKYDFIVETDGDNGASVYAGYNSVGWSAEEDQSTLLTTTFESLALPNLAGDADRSVRITKAAPASAQGTFDNTVSYTRTVTGVAGAAAGYTCVSTYVDNTATTPPTGFSMYYERTATGTNGSGDLTYTGSNLWVRNDAGSQNPEEFNSTSGIANLFGGTTCAGLNQGLQGGTSTNGTDGPTYTVTYTAVAGEFSGTVQDGRWPGFVSEVNLVVQTLGAGSKYVDVKVRAYLDTDGSGSVTGTETRSNEITVRFWNPDALTPVLTLANSGQVWFENAGEDVSVVTETYISQELNNVYTTVLGDVNDNYTVVNDRNYAASRDGYVHLGHSSLSSGNYHAALNTFDFGPATKYSGKHLFLAKTILAEQEDINRISVVDADQTQTDTFFAATVRKIVSGPLMVSFLQRTVKDAVALPVESEVVIARFPNAYESDSLAHESATQVQYVITLLSADVTNWSEFGTTVGSATGIPAAAVTLNGTYSGNTAMGGLSINGTSILDATSNATKAAGSFKMDATSNAAGQIVLTIAVASPSAALRIDLTNVQVQGATYGLDDSDNSAANIEFQASNWQLVNELNAEDSSVRHVQVGDSTNVRYDVRDQFMRAPANGVARILFEYNNNTVGNNVTGQNRSFIGSIGDTVNVTDGGATVVVPDVNPAAMEGSVTVSAKLFIRTSFGGWPALEIASEPMTIDYVNNAVVDQIVQIDSSSTAQISYFNFSNINTELSRTTAAQKATIAGVDAVDSAATEIHGIVRTAEGLPLRGHKVTISGAGLLFSDVDEFFGVGSLTLFTNSSGEYKFDVVGQVVGTTTLTISAGGKSVTATHITTGGNVRAHNVAITSPFAAKAGTADALTALVTDRYGNLANGKAVTFSVVSGSGYIQTPATSNTGANGVATADLIIMSGEVGFNSTVRAAITQEAFAAVGNNAAAQRSAGDTNVGKTTAWTKLQADGTAKMYAKNIVGAGKVQFYHNGKEIAWVRAADALNPKLRAANGAFYLVRTVELVAGKNVLEVYIDGERVRRTAYSK